MCSCAQISAVRGIEMDIYEVRALRRSLWLWRCWVWWIPRPRVGVNSSQLMISAVQRWRQCAWLFRIVPVGRHGALSRQILQTPLRRKTQMTRRLDPSIGYKHAYLHGEIPGKWTRELTNDVPQFSTFANLLGNILKSTAKIATHVITIMLPL